MPGRTSVSTPQTTSNGACGWGTARFDEAITCVQYGPGLGDVIAAGASDGRIHFICAQTGEKILSPQKVDNEVEGVAYSRMGQSWQPPTAGVCQFSTWRQARCNAP
jgi:WD40 repeat protein